jgi:hypothetical protein
MATVTETVCIGSHLQREVYDLCENDGPVVFHANNTQHITLLSPASTNEISPITIPGKPTLNSADIIHLNTTSIEPFRRKRSSGKNTALLSTSANGDTVPRTSKRRITKTTPFDFQFSHNEEQLLIQQAMRLSKKETHRVKLEASEAPVFRPSLEEFADPLAYIAK